jgi:Phytanoyl-CoA dioxygenase (PhyH)
MKDFLNHGFVILKEVIPSALATNLRESIQNQLVINAQELEVAMNDYLYCTGRWASPSHVVSCIDEEINFTIQGRLENLLAKKIKMEKCNVICKNSNIKDAVPLHQDISYSPKSPYHFSLWLALNDVDELSGALQFIEGSHKWPISPAVDFWSPKIKLNSTLEQKYQKQLQRIKIKEGDAVMFDSRLWHGSIKSASGDDRYAYVSRWEILGQAFPEIPSIQPAYFGMWNCHQITNDILKKGLQIINPKIAANDNFIELIEEWQTLMQGNQLFETMDKAQLLKDLENVKILHIAANKHNAGDLTGRIYKNLWNSLLCHLQNKSPST